MPTPIMLACCSWQPSWIPQHFVCRNLFSNLNNNNNKTVNSKKLDTWIHPEKKWIIGVRISNFARSFWQQPKGPSLDGYRPTATILVLRAHDMKMIPYHFCLPVNYYRLPLSCHTHINIIFGVPFNQMMLSYIGTCMQLSTPQRAIDDKNNN